MKSGVIVEFGKVKFPFITAVRFVVEGFDFFRLRSEIAVNIGSDDERQFEGLRDAFGVVETVGNDAAF